MERERERERVKRGELDMTTYHYIHVTDSLQYVKLASLKLPPIRQAAQ